MKTPTIVKTTKDYLLVKIPLPKREGLRVRSVGKNGRMNPAEKKLWKIIQEGERDFREGRVIRAPSIKEALRRYEKRQWG
ncbi:hypothetical protein HYW67_01845 [Candidatus Parcubacteria bacterium]|nr:hypothetical protein [Candidatus Parcubacteria bacterium]